MCPHSRQARLAGVLTAHSQLTVSLQLSADLPSCNCLYIRLLVKDGPQMVYTSLRLPMIQGILQHSAHYSAHYTSPYITECVLVSSLSQGVIDSSALPVQTDGSMVGITMITQPIFMVLVFFVILEKIFILYLHSRGVNATFFYCLHPVLCTTWI